MIEYQELRNDIDRYLMERFKYRKSLVCLTVDNIIATPVSSLEKNIFTNRTLYIIYNPQIQISAESETKRSIFRKRDKTKRSKKESAQHSKSRNKSFVMTSVSAL